MEISKTTIIEAPASLVFQILMDIDLATTWVPMLESYRLTSKSPNQVGSIYQSQYNQNGMRFEQTAEITDYVENQLVKWTATTPFCDAKVAYSLTEISDIQTELKHITECNYKGLTKLLAWLGKSKFKKASEDILDKTHRNLKSIVEMTHWS